MGYFSVIFFLCVCCFVHEWKTALIPIVNINRIHSTEMRERKTEGGVCMCGMLIQFAMG